jgi:hypothetical protein
MRFLSEVLFWALVVFAMYGCAPAPTVEPIEYRFSQVDFANNRSTSLAPETAKPRCNLIVHSIVDKRHGKDGFGALSYVDSYAESVPRWVRDGLAALSQAHYRVSFDETGSPAPRQGQFLVIDVEILKAYLHTVVTAKSATLVLSVNYRPAGRPGQVRIYRSQKASVNWTASASEVEAAMNMAMTAILADIADDIALKCGTQASRQP